ncbi:hypothetical protein OL341_003582 [Vibrio parahaemolyticus]|nr:hypothetical protein [Vibrio parahaemolyticus]
MTTLLNTDTNKTIKVIKLSVNEAVSAATCQTEADAYKALLRSNFNCYAFLSNGEISRLTCTQMSLQEYAQDQIADLNKQGGNWQIQASHLKLIS